VKIDSDIDSEWAGVDGVSRDQRMRVIRVNSDIDNDFVGKSDFEGYRGFDGGIDLGWVGGGGRGSRSSREGSGGGRGRGVGKGKGEGEGVEGGLGRGEVIQEVDSEIDSGYLDMYSANSDIEEGYVDGGEIVPTKHVGGGRKGASRVDGRGLECKNETPAYIKEYLTEARAFENEQGAKYRPELAVLEEQRQALADRRFQIEQELAMNAAPSHTQQLQSQNLQNSGLSFKETVSQSTNSTDWRSNYVPSQKKYEVSYEGRPPTKTSTTCDYSKVSRANQLIRSDLAQISNIKNRITGVDVGQAIQFGENMATLRSKFPDFNKITTKPDLVLNNKKFDIFYTKTYQQPDPRLEVNAGNFGLAVGNLLYKKNEDLKAKGVQKIMVGVGGLLEGVDVEKEERRRRFEAMALGDFRGSMLEGDFEKWKRQGLWEYL
jgi:hypothetical protein